LKKFSKTKRRILDVTLDLFNKRGLNKSSQHTIAEALDMSPGNLTYHYHKKEDLTHALFHEMIAELNGKFEEFVAGDDYLGSLVNFLDDILESFHKYRFVYIDLFYILNRYPDLAKIYIALLANRKSQYNKMMKKLIKDGYVTKPAFKGQHELTWENLNLVTTQFFSNYARMKGKEKDKLKFHKKVILNAAYPVLTAKGRKKIMSELT